MLGRLVGTAGGDGLEAMMDERCKNVVQGQMIEL